MPTEEETKREEALKIFRQILREKERERAKKRRDKTRKKKYGARTTRKDKQQI